MSNPEKKFVRFTRSVRAENEDYARGDIEAFSSKTCAELIAVRAAEPYTPPEKVSRETAALPRLDTASSPAAKKATKKFKR